MRKFLLTLCILLLILVVGGFFGLRYLTADQTLSEETQLTIEDGSSTASIANQLEDKGLIANSYAFRFFSRQHGLDGQFKAGEYTVEPGKYSLLDVCELLVNGGVSFGDQLKLTITEGQRIKDIVVTFTDLGICTAEEFDDYVKNGDFSLYPYIPNNATENRLEGFLPAETFWLDPSWDVATVIDMLLEYFDESVWTDERDAQAKARSMTVSEVLTMASIVEREAVADEDRPLIAGVFYNRLGIDMMLQSNVTVEYAMGQWKLDLTTEDIKIDSPYNTYLHTGLPPGPVCTPGLLSIDAALWPEDSEYLYFWGQKDGTTRFSTTLEEHNAGGEGDL